MIKKTLFLVFSGLLVYVVVLVVNTPVRFVWEQLSDILPIRQLPVKVNAIQGTLWDGEAMLRHSSATGVLAWDISFLRIFIGSPLAKLKMRAVGIELDLDITPSSFSKISVDGRGSADLSMLEPMFRRHRISAAGEVIIRDLSVVIDTDTGRPEAAKGRLSWEGGSTAYPVGRQIQSAQIPPLDGILEENGEDIVLNLVQREGQAQIVNVQLKSDGFAHVQVRKRLLDLANAPWSGKAGPDDIVFRVKQRLF